MSDETTGSGPAGGENAVGSGSGTAETGAGTQPDSTRGRRGVRGGLTVLAVLALAAGMVGSWAYNRGLAARQQNDATVVRAAANPSTYVKPGDYSEVTVPIRNDGPFAVTVVGLYLPTAPRVLWDGAWTVIKPGATADLRVQAPFGCAAIPHTLKHTTAVPVLLRVMTVNGNTHTALRTMVSGVIQYAADYCFSETPAKKDDA